MSRSTANRRAWCALIGGAATLAVSATASIAADPNLEAKSSTAAAIEGSLAATGSVRVIVRHKAAVKPESYAGGVQGLDGIQSAIGSVQGGLVGALTAGNADKARRMAIRRMSHLPIIAMTVNPEELKALLADGRVERVWEDRNHFPALDHSVPLVFGAPPARPADAGGAPAAANLPTGKGTVVAILDTGVDTTHPFFGGRVTHEACFSTTDSRTSSRTLCPNGLGSQIGKGAGCPPNPTGEACRHGSHVAGIAAGRNAPGPQPARGVAPDAHIFSIQVFHWVESAAACGRRGAPCVVSSTSDMLAGLNHLLAHASLPDGILASVNMSIGVDEPEFGPCDDNPLTPAIDALRARGVATVISAGNDSWVNAVGSPACVASAVTVGSTTTRDAISTFSDISAMVDVLAPGTGILSAVPHGKFESMSGTSMAAPHVAGAIAVLRSAFPKASVDQIEAALKSTGVAVRDRRTNATHTLPRISIDKALLALQAAQQVAATPPVAATPAPTVATVPPLAAPAPAATSAPAPTPVSTGAAPAPAPAGAPAAAPAPARPAAECDMNLILREDSTAKAAASNCK